MRRNLVLSLLLMLALPALTYADAVRVAVTIKPVHSLVSGIMKGVGEPALIMTGSTTPHHYSLRPSERRMLSDADLIFWVGPELESFMPRILHSLDAATTSVALAESAGLEQLPARSSHGGSHTSSHIDPHIWLSAKNAHAMLDAIARELIEQDAANADAYESNRQRLHQRISETDLHIRRMLTGKQTAFLSYHDAYQYFERAYGLKNAGFVSIGDEISPSARHVHELRELIRDQQVRCLFYEAPSRPPLVDALIRDLPVQALELDAIGTRTTAGEHAWFEIMHKLAEAFVSCL